MPAEGVEGFPTILTLVRFLDLQPNVSNSSTVFNQQTSQTRQLPMQSNS